MGSRGADEVVVRRFDESQIPLKYENGLYKAIAQQLTDQGFRLHRDRAHEHRV